MGNIYFKRPVWKRLSAAFKPRKDNLNAKRYKFNCINCKRSFPTNVFKKNQKVHFNTMNRKYKYRRNMYIT